MLYQTAVLINMIKNPYCYRRCFTAAYGRHDNAIGINNTNQSYVTTLNKKIWQRKQSGHANRKTTNTGSVGPSPNPRAQPSPRPELSKRALTPSQLLRRKSNTVRQTPLLWRNWWRFRVREQLYQDRHSRVFGIVFTNKGGGGVKTDEEDRGGEGGQCRCIPWQVRNRYKH